MDKPTTGLMDPHGAAKPNICITVRNHGLNKPILIDSWTAPILLPHGAATKREVTSGVALQTCQTWDISHQLLGKSSLIK